MAKYVKEYHEGLTADSIKVMTVYRLSVAHTLTHPQYPGQVHQHFFEENGALLYSYLMDYMGDMKHIDSIKIEKI